MERYLNTTTLKQEKESNADNIIDSDPRVSNWFKPKPEGFKGEWVDGTYTFVEIPWPTQAELDSNAQATINSESRAYLNATDWYVTRESETGVAVPDDVAQLRSDAREAIA